MERAVEALRDARQRVRLGLELHVELDALLDEAAELLEEAETDVSLVEARRSRQAAERICVSESEVGDG